jgi:hypothetical protein
MHDCPAPPVKPIHFHFNLGSIIKLPSKPGKDIPYSELICTDQDKAYIVEIITTIADNSKFSLLLKQTHLKNLGAVINHVHPYKFLVVATSSPQLKAAIALIFDDYFKKNGFMDGLGARLSTEAEKGSLEQYLPQFAAEIGIPAEEVQPFLRSREWDGFIHFLINL